MYGVWGVTAPASYLDCDLHPAGWTQYPQLESKMSVSVSQHPTHSGSLQSWDTPDLSNSGFLAVTLFLCSGERERDGEDNVRTGDSYVVTVGTDHNTRSH